MRACFLLLTGAPAFDVAAMRQIIDGHDLDVRDLMYSIFANDKPFRTKNSPVGVPVYTAMDYNTTKEEQREVCAEFFLSFLLRRSISALIVHDYRFCRIDWCTFTL